MPFLRLRSTAASLFLFGTLAVSASLFTTVPVVAQTSQGTLVGVTRDATGAGVPHATITATNQSTGEKRTVTSGNDGSFRIDAIAPGQYTITTSAPGFGSAQAKDLTVTPSVVTSYNATLQVGATNTEVTVEANQASVDTTDGTLSGVVGAVELDKLPVFTLNPVELALTVPGVQPVISDGQFSNGVNIQVNGARPRDNNFLMDGQEINDVGIGGQAFQPQVPDMFDSVTVITNAASAEFGRGSGGIVNLVTKQGTNSYHGEVFERYTGSGLNAIPGGSRGPTSVTGYQKARSDQHSYGFTAGGPIIKSKLFAFGGLFLQRLYGQETPGINLLPDAAGYATLQTITGSAASQVQLLDQYLSSGSYLKSDVIYGNANGSAVVTSKNVGALPGCPSTGCVITFAAFQRPNVAEKSPDTQWTYRVDYSPWDKDHFAFRYLHDRTSLTPDFFNNPLALQGFDTEQGGPSELGDGQWTHTFTANLLNEFRVSEARIGFTFSPTAATVANPLNSLPTLSFASLSGNAPVGTVRFPALGPNQNFPQGRKEDLYQFQDTVRYTWGRNSISVGADIGRLIEIDLVSQNALGTLNFASAGTGGSLGNFLQNQLGPSGTATKTFGKTRADSHGYRNGIFVQDDLKVNTDLTLNLGVRYDFLSNPENSLQYPGIDVRNPFAPINTVVKIQNDYNNIAPRLGFAYSPHNGGFLRDGKTVIRGGFGIFYDSTFSNILVNSTQSSPNAVAGSIVGTASNPQPGATGLISTISATLNPLSSVTSEASNLVNPLTYQWNFGVERELPGQVVLGVRYIGDRGEKEFANQQFNYFNGLTQARLNTSRGAINVRGNYADSEYNGLEISGTHNFSHGLLVRANYVYSKDLDDGSEIFTISSGYAPTSYSANLAPGGRGQDWGPSAYDHRQFFSVAYVYQVPGLHSSNHLTDLAENILTRHWTVSGVTQLQSGQYGTFNTNGVDLNGDGSTSNDRPIVVNKSADPQSVGVDGFFIGGTSGVYYDMNAVNNTGALTPVSVNQVHFLVPHFPDNSLLHQEIGRNSVMLPGTTTNNLALEKGFDFRERATFILRAEAQNVWNHNDNAIGDTDVLDAGAGFLQPGRVATNRTLVLWGKLQF